MHTLYYVIKFHRRVSHRIAAGLKSADDLSMWPCIRDTVSAHIRYLLTTVRHVKAPAASQPIHAYTDASDSGYGVVVLSNPPVTLSGRWTDAQRMLHINVKELLAVRELAALLADAPHTTAPAAYIIHVDNTSALSWCTKRYARHFLVCRIAAEIDELLADIEVQFTYVESAENLADEASRL